MLKRCLLPGLIAAQLAISTAGTSAQQPGADDAKGRKQSQEPRPAALSTAFVPPEVVGLNMVRPRRIVELPSMSAVRDAIAKNPGFVQMLSVPVEEIDQLTSFGLKLALPDARGNDIFARVYVVQARSATVAGAAAKRLAGKRIDPVAGEPAIFERSKGAEYYTLANGRFIVSSTHLEGLRRAIKAGIRSAPPRFIRDWKSLSENDGVLVRGGEIFPPSHPNPGTWAILSPVARETRFVAITFRAGETLEATLNVETDDNEAAKRLSSAFPPLVKLICDGLNSLESGDTGRLKMEPWILAELGQPIASLLRGLEIELAGGRFTGRARHAMAPIAQKIAGLIPSADRVREEEVATRDLRNLKKIAQAMDAYADEHGTFPAAYPLGPDGKTRHSWRVALLPYLDEEALYAEYRRDQRWDSPANRKLLARIPSVYKSPLDPPESVNASYFVFVGSTTPFEGTQAVSRTVVYDGTSNTVVAVEAKRDIPWTKPEDMAFDENQPVPDFGGKRAEGVMAAFCDGTAELIPDNVPEEIWRRLIVRDSSIRFPRIEKTESDWRWEWQEKARQTR